MLMMLSVMAAMMSSLIATILLSLWSVLSMALPGVTSSGLSRWGSLIMTMRLVAVRAVLSRANNVDSIIIMNLSLVFIILSCYSIYCAN